MESTFSNAKISHIIAFDHFEFKFSQENIKALKASTICGVNPLVEEKKLNDRIYSKVFIDRYPKILNLNVKIDIKDYINKTKDNIDSEAELKHNSVIKLCTNSLSPKVIINICFDQIGVSSARFDFEINKPVKTSELIKNADITACYVDEILINELRNLMNQIPQVVNEEIINKVHDTYSVISSTDSDINLSVDKDEISGIVSLTNNYIHFNKDMVEKKTENEFSHYEGTLIMVGYSATFMMFQNPERFAKKPENYIDERITAIEMYHRQKYLLKKLDIYLDNLLKDLKDNSDFNVNSLKSKMNEIKKTQMDIQSKLEIYRNTRMSIKASFIMFFDILNGAFRLDKHYNFVLERLDACKSIYESLNDEKRNNLMENIQWIVIIIGIATIILSFLVDVVYGSMGFNKAINIFGILYIFFTFALVFFIRRSLN